MRFIYFAFLIALVLGIKGYSQHIEHLDNSHVHEAFMNIEAPIPLLTAIPHKPPPPLEEKIPPRKDSQTVWVKGYWEWSMIRNEFVWCSGNWRRPPVGHQWIPGSWIQVDEGWVRLRGFWSTIPESHLSYIKQIPPDPYDENPENRPGDDYFWMAGYWKYEHDEYVWYTGKWELMDQSWIYVPAKYIWRPQGYVFVPAFWDWPLDLRGTPYVCVAIDPSEHSIIYTSDMIVDPISILDGCLLYYPNYYYFYFYYCFFYIDWWWGCDWCPPWWGWEAWWWMPWWDHWGLWWWWSHPGFPVPGWFDPIWLSLIWEAPQPLMKAMGDVHPPLIIGNKMLIPPAALLNVNKSSVFPENPVQIQTEAGQSIVQGTSDRPNGSKTPHDELESIAPPPGQATSFPPSSAQQGRQPSLPLVPSSVRTPLKLEEPSQPSFMQPPSYHPQQPPSYQPHWPSQTPGYAPQRPSHTLQPPSYMPNYTPQTPSHQHTHTQQTPNYTPNNTPQSPSHTPSYIPRTPTFRRNIQPQTPQFAPSQPPNNQHLY